MDARSAGREQPAARCRETSHMGDSGAVLGPASHLRKEIEAEANFGGMC